MKRLLALLTLVFPLVAFAQAPILRNSLTTNVLGTDLLWTPVNKYLQVGGNATTGFLAVKSNNTDAVVFNAAGNGIYAGSLFLTGQTNKLSMNSSNLLFNGHAVLTNAPGSGITNSGTGTVNTLAIWTGTNSLGNSFLTDDGSTLSYAGSTLSLGTNDGAVSQITIQPVTTTNSFGGIDINFIAGAVDGSTTGTGGSINFTATDGVGIDQDGGSLTFNSGSKTGSGNPGNISMTSVGDINLTAGLYFSIIAPNGLNPLNDNLYVLGTNGARWLTVYSYGEDVDGDIRVSGNVSPRDVPYIWPVSQGAAGTMLINDGGGILTWEPTNSVSAETTATNIVTIGQTGTNAAQLDFALVARGGIFKLQATNNVFIGTPANVNNTDFKKCYLAIQQPSTGTCLVQFTNGSFSAPEGQPLIIDTNNGAVTYYEMLSDVFTNGLVQVWMSTKMKRVP